MNVGEPESPRHWGDYPDGAYWSAYQPPGRTEPDEPDYTVDGTTIKFMWDYGVTVPRTAPGDGLGDRDVIRIVGHNAPSA